MTAFLKYKAIRILFVAIIFALFGYMFMPFFTPLLMAALFGFALEPVVSKYAARKSRRKLPTAILLFSFFVFITVPSIIVAYRVVNKMKEYSAVGFTNLPVVQSANNVLDRFSVYFNRIVEQVNVDPVAAKDQVGIIGKVGAWLMAYATGIVTGLPDFVLALFVFTAALYYFLTESAAIKRSILRLDLITSKEISQIIQVVQKSSYTSLVVTAGIGTVQGLVVAIGGSIFGYHEFLLTFLLTFFFSFLPLVGTSPIPLMMALVSFMQGQNGSGIGLILVAIVAGSIDNILKPFLLNSSEDELHPVVSLLAIIGAVIVYGLPGIFLGPILTQLAFKIIPILFEADSDSQKS